MDQAPFWFSNLVAAAFGSRLYSKGARRRRRSGQGLVMAAQASVLESRRLLSATKFTAIDQQIQTIDWMGEVRSVEAGSWIVGLDGSLSVSAGTVSATQSILFAQQRGNSGVQIDRVLMGGHSVEITSTADATYTEVLAQVSGLPGFRYLEPNFVVSTNAIPNDPDFSNLYGLHNTGQTGGTIDADIDAPEAWDISTGSSSVVVGVIDTGVDYDHPDLNDNIWTNPGEIAGDGIDNDANGFIDDIHGWDFYNDDNDPYDDNRHGTHVAGTIGATGNNGAGVVGVAQDVSIMALKFLGRDGSGFVSDAIDAINYATMMNKRGVNIRLTNNSWSGGGFSQALYDAIQAHGNAGILFIAAAGNDAYDNDVNPSYPSGYNLDNIIAVAATDENDTLASFSQYGATTVDLAAPGVSTLSTTPGNTYTYLSGTSMATPHVSGAAALAFSVAPSATAAQVKDAILASVDQKSGLSDRVLTGGRLNAANTLLQLAANGPYFGPIILSASPVGTTTGPISFVDFTFSEAMDTNSFSLASDIVSFTGPGGVNLVPEVTGFTWTGNTLRVSFHGQSAVGSFSMVIGPEILSATGHAMNQDHDAVLGESIDDRYTASFNNLGAYIVAATPREISAGPFTFIDFTFSEAMDTSSFSTAVDIASFTGPGGIDLLSAITGFAWTQNTLRVAFSEQSAPGSYSMTIGPHILAVDGNAMDQDHDNIAGEVNQDQYTVAFNNPGPFVTASSPAAMVFGPVSFIDFTFSESMNSGSFSAATDINEFTGPGGVNLLPQVTGFSWTGPNLRVSFIGQAAAGSYSMTIGPDILALDGHAMDQDRDNVIGEAVQDSYTASFIIPHPARYISLANLGTGGTTYFGADAYDRSGVTVSSAGDVNGDGFDDVIIGAKYANGPNNARFASGESYVIFGSATPPSSIDLGNLGTAGFTLYGADLNDVSGIAVSGIGDMNGDGFDDLAIGTRSGNGEGSTRPNAGGSHVIFGRAAFPAAVDLATLGTDGITIFGGDVFDRSGFSVSSAGDTNGDGFDDLLIGAYRGDALDNGKSDAGESYVVFGAATLPTTVDLRNLGTAGITIFGAAPGDWTGFSVSSAGDLNNDGFDDLVIGAPSVGAQFFGSLLPGKSYVIFGGTTLPATIDLENPGTAGITIFGEDPVDWLGVSVSNAGDVNGDGFDDLIIGARFADGLNNSRRAAGESYLIFGGPLLPATINISDLGSSGIRIIGTDVSDNSGNSVSSAGDINGDGFDDLIIGAMFGAGLNNAKSTSGESYVIFGNSSLPAIIDMANPTTPTVSIIGVDVGDRSGQSVSSAGDINGDGFDDLIIGSDFAGASGNAKSYAGESYVVFGRNDFTSSVTHLGTESADTLTGTFSANMMVGGRGNDTLIGNGGADVIIGGQGNDILAAGDVGFKRIVGGTGSDTLRLDGTGLSLDLTTLRDNRILGIETIDITGSGNNTLTLSKQEVLNISDESNTLTVLLNAGDVINIGSGWTQGASQTTGLNSFLVFTQGAATLRILNNAPVNIAPVIGAFDTAITFKENSPAVLLDVNTTVSDIDSSDLVGGTLTVALTNNAESTDLLEIRNQGMAAGQIGVSGTNVTYGGIVIGTLTGGAGTTPLVVTLTSALYSNPVSIQTLLRNITFRNTSETPSPLARTVRVTLTDGDGGTSNQPTKTINVSPVNDAPLIAQFDTTIDYTENDPGLLLDPDALVTDVDSENFDTGKLSVQLIASQRTDLLEIRNIGTDPGQIGVSGAIVTFGGTTIGTFTGGSGPTPLVVTFNANSTPASVQELLRNITYRNLSDNPATAARTARVIMTDGDGGISNLSTKTINVIAVNDAPTVTGFDGSVTYVENRVGSILDANANVFDVDSSDLVGGTLTVELTNNAESTDLLEIRNRGVAAGQIGVSGTNVTYGGVVIGTFTGGAGTTPLVVTLTSALYSNSISVGTLLRNITFRNTSETPSPLARTVRVTLTDGDGGTSNQPTKPINVSAVNDVPLIAQFDTAIEYTENDPGLLIDPDALVTDFDSDNFDTGRLSVQLIAASQRTDLLEIRHIGTDPGQIGVSGTNVTFGGTTIGTFTGGSGPTPLVVTFNANSTPASAQELLRNITYRNLSDNPSNAARTVRVTMTDGDGGISNPSAKTINVIAVNDAPTIGLFDTPVSYRANGAAAVLDTNATIVDVDSVDFNTGILTIELTANAESTDLLEIRNVGTGIGQIGVSGSDITFGGMVIGSFTGELGTPALVVTLNASATPIAVRTLLRNCTYRSTASTPSTVARTVQVSLTDGDGGISNLPTKQIDVSL